MGNFVKRKKRNSQSGQAIIEFIIVFAIILTLLFVFIQLSWSIAFGHYAHYATYISSRAFYSGGQVYEDQSTAAKTYLKKMLKTAAGKDLFPFLAKARKGGDRDIQGAEPIEGAFIGMHPEAEGQPNSRFYSWAEGVQYNFSVPLFLLPLASWAKNEGAGKSIKGGTATESTKGIEWKGAIPFTSDSFLGREVTVTECFTEMTRLSTGTGISRGDGQEFLEDNGC